MKIEQHAIDVAGGPGRKPIRCVVVKPNAPGRRFPGVLAYSDIFQLTPSTLRCLQRIASHGYVVVAPELYAQQLPAGTVFDFERDRQAALDASERLPLVDIDADRRAVLDALHARDDVALVHDGVYALGFCIGGHLALRAALEPDVRATACFYATGVHSGKLGAATGVDTLQRASSISGDVLLVWGRQDPHIPSSGRSQIHRALDDAEVRFETRIYDAEHAFARDEGPRYDAQATDDATNAVLALFQTTRARR